MAEPAGPAPDRCRAAERLSGPARRVHLAVLAAFTETGRPPPSAELDRLTRAHGAEHGSVRAELAGADLLAFTAGGEIRAAYPFSPRPTPIRVSWAGGPQAYAMCAIDALGMSAMLGLPVSISAAEPGTGRAITVAVDRDRARWKPRTTVVFAGAACGASGPAARAWARHHPEVSGTVMRRDGALRAGIAEFGALLQAPPPADAAGSPA
jgi:hypothetical protein